TDPATHTQIPLSYRGWPGTFSPRDIGMSDFDFVAMFARHLPGGGVGEPDKLDAKDPNTRRMLVTGTLQVDCLICHDTSGRYTYEPRFNALKAQDFKWATTVAEGLGTISGFRTAKSLADSWRSTNSPPPTNVPAIKYERDRFDAENNVLLQMSKKSSANACYYCHSSTTHDADLAWHSDGDVHLRAGMTCTDCHRNGVDHMIVRGYEGEVKDRTISSDMIALRVKMLLRDDATLTEEKAKPIAEKQLKAEQGRIETLSCRGCHMGSQDTQIAGTALAPTGRLGSPRPIHKGFPPVHLERLTCTACHSGPMPGMDEQVAHTSMAHKLGLPGPERGENMAPVIVEPVFLRDGNGRVAPFKMVWPSYWGRISKDGKIKPMLPEEVAKTVRFPTPSSDEVQRDPYNSKPLTSEQIQNALEKLSSDKTKDEPVFIASGKMYRLEGGALKSSENDAAKPYAWALAHDVRPARQALGARGCDECHSDHAPIYLGAIAARGPVKLSQSVTHQMWELRGDNKAVFATFAYSFLFRPWLKVICFSAAFVVLAVLVSFGVLGVGAITGRARAKQNSFNREK
ncbi:MAG TPA: multiheme c-type cytochrome, partial [Verrucomicrobiae bacterium]|nr:multiheme c-type cytochrome [Verrucomicrobiae bacterium]